MSRADASALELDGRPGITESDPAGHALPSQPAEGSATVAANREPLDLLTITAMPSDKVSELLAALGCTSVLLRRRGMDLWHTQTVTMDAGLKKAASYELELKLGDASIANCVCTFREVLRGHERDLFDRYLYVLSTIEHIDADDQACVGAALQCLEREQRSRGAKRKHGQWIQQAEAPCCDPDVSVGAADNEVKRIRSGGTNLEEVVILLGLAGIPTAKILESGVALYCEAHRRPNPIAQKYAAKYILECLPHATSGCLLHLFYYLLGDSLFVLLCDELRTQAQVASRHRSSVAAQRMDSTGVQALIFAYQTVLERVAHNCTAFERRQRVRQLTEAAMSADSAALAQTFYEHLAPGEREAWGQQLVATYP